jgi:hypothetical protein
MIATPLITNDETYFAFPAISNSKLGEIKRALLGEPAMLPYFEALRFGSLFHKLLLEFETFDFRLYTGRERVKAMKLQESIERNCPKIWLEGEKEKPFVYDFLGWRCKMKVDLLNHRTKVLTDFKTTAARTKTDFLGAIVKYDYMRQGAWYLDCPKVKDAGIDTFRLIAVSKVEPFDVFYWTMDRNDERLNDGRDDYLSILEHMTDDDQFSMYRCDWKAPEIHPRPTPVIQDFSKISFSLSTNHTKKMNEQDQQTTNEQSGPDLNQFPGNRTEPPSSENITPDVQQSNHDLPDQESAIQTPGEDSEFRERGAGILDSVQLSENGATVEDDVIDPDKPIEIDPNAPVDDVTANIQAISSGPKIKQLSTRRVQNQLSHDELDEMSRNLSRQTLEIVSLETEKKESNKYFADKISRLRKQNNVLATKLEAGEEEIDVAVEIIFNSPTLGKKTIIRQDTFEAWEEDMTEAEYRLDNLPPINVNDGSNDEDAEDPDVDQESNNEATGDDEMIVLNDSETRPENIFRDPEDHPGDDSTFVDENGEEFTEIKMPGELSDIDSESGTIASTDDEPPFKPITEQ